MKAKAQLFLTLFMPMLVVGALGGAMLASSTVQAAPVVGFEPGRIIDDDVFTASGSMGVTEIQNFLNSKVPNCDTWGTRTSEFGGGTRAQWGTAHGYPPPYTCLKDYSENGVSAAKLISDRAKKFSINPQVLLVMLQKEQGLITDTWPTSQQYRTAMGYGCPDNSGCDSKYYGLFNQLWWASRMFRLILNDSPNWTSYYVLGNNTIKWHKDAPCGSSTVNIENRSTQALYNYTPYRPNQAALNAGWGTGDACSTYGNRNFYLYFTDWFGSVRGDSYYSCRDGQNLASVGSGPKILRNRLSYPADNVALTVANNTGSKCAEVHTWTLNFQNWLRHTSTSSYTFDPAHSSIVSGEIGRNDTRMYKVDYRHTSSGRVELHGWDTLQQRWVSHIASNAGPIDPTASEVIMADTNGDNVSEIYLIDYANTGSGMVELHGWSSDMQQWTRHTATNLPAFDPIYGRVIAADLDGDGREEFSYIKYGNQAQSGAVELHTWAPNMQQWTRHTATNLPAVGFTKATDDLLVADTDGNNRDELFFVKYSGSASGRVEIHGWSPDLQTWVSHVATSTPSF